MRPSCIGENNDANGEHLVVFYTVYVIHKYVYIKNSFLSMYITL